AVIHAAVGSIAGIGTPLEITSALINEGSPSVCTDSGSFYVQSSIAGSIVYYRDHTTGTEPSTRPVNAAVVGLHRETNPMVFEQAPSGTSVTGCSGEYLLSGLKPLLNYHVEPRKNGDLLGAVDPFDASLNAQYVVGLIPLTFGQRLAADATGNGSLTSFDSVQIARLSVGLIQQLPVAVLNGSDWAFMPSPAPSPD